MHSTALMCSANAVSNICFTLRKSVYDPLYIKYDIEHLQLLGVFDEVWMYLLINNAIVM